MKTRSFAAALVLTIFGAGPVAAQATRTWVSGVGDDANPCSRTAPCKTFAGAISKTAASGEINVLDPGGFGAVTITKSISIEAEGVIAGVIVSGTNGIVVQAGATDTVVLRGLTIDGIGGQGLNGVLFHSGGNLVIDRCTIKGFGQKGIAFLPSAASLLFITNTKVRDNYLAAGGGIHVKPLATGSSTVTLDNVELENNYFGFIVEDNSTATIRNSIAAHSVTDGISLISNVIPVVLHVESTAANNNGGAGLRASGSGAYGYASNMLITGNRRGIELDSGGHIISWGNNRIFANSVTDGLPSATIGQQ